MWYSAKKAPVIVSKAKILFYLDGLRADVLFSRVWHFFQSIKKIILET
jgi:hypothetical protein